MSSFLENLIEEVRQIDCLYNLKSHGYRRVDVKEKIWGEIAEKLDVEVKVCKGRWKSLRDRFRKELALRNLPSGSEAKIFKPWPYFEALFFLKISDCKKKTITNIELPVANFDNEEIYVSVDDSFNNYAMIDDNTIEFSNSTEISASTPTESSSRSRSKRDDVEKEMTSFLRTATETFNAPIKSPISIFLSSIAAHIDGGNVSPAKLLKFQQTVLNAAYEATEE